MSQHSVASRMEGRVPWQDLLRVALVAIAAAAVWFRVWEPLPRISIIGLIATIAGGWPIFKEAIENILEHKMTMELSMTIALGAALAIGEFFTALVITGFVLAAEILEELNVSRGRKAIGDLLEYLPRAVTVRRDGILAELPIDELRAGDLVLIKPGSRLPVDGIVLSGHSFVDQAAITGEPMPAEKVAGSRVYAGTVNQSGALEVEAERLGRDTTFGRIVEAVETAERSRAPIQKTADRLAGYLVYFALIAAAITFLITRDVRSTISVIIVAGACGVAAGTPLAILGGIGRAARLGAIIKGGLYLELLARVDTIAFDKTGTLTFGVPQVQELHPADGVGDSDLLAVAAAPERASEHPVAKAILARARALALEIPDPDQFFYTPGQGVAARVDGHEVLVGSRGFLEAHRIPASPAYNPNQSTEVFVARDGHYLGTICVAGRIRPEAKAAVAALKRMGTRTILLTGDSRTAASTVGLELGVDEVTAELLPEAKVIKVEELVNRGRTVVMVGDGINDAPALAKAHVGIAMGSGTDIARESAQVVLLGNDLMKLVEIVKLAVDSAGMGLAAFGLLNPLLAAFIHVASELAFILNSARLLPKAPLRASSHT